jgi:hypothetical protein
VRIRQANKAGTVDALTDCPHVDASNAERLRSQCSFRSEKPRKTAHARSGDEALFRNPLRARERIFRRLQVATEGLQKINSHGQPAQSRDVCRFCGDNGGRRMPLRSKLARFPAPVQMLTWCRQRDSLSKFHDVVSIPHSRHTTENKRLSCLSLDWRAACFLLSCWEATTPVGDRGMHRKRSVVRIRVSELNVPHSGQRLTRLSAAKHNRHWTD